MKQEDRSASFFYHGSMTEPQVTSLSEPLTKAIWLQRRSRRAAVLLLIWTSIGVIGFERYSPPAPQPATVSPAGFSADRALSMLRVLVGNGIPHPTGSRQNQVVRDQIMSYLREFGYEPEIQNRRFDDGTWIDNVLARHGSANADAAIALVAHYDSVDVGPGASDDGVGVVALLEVARMLKQRNAARNDVIFCFTDGEEAGTLGAEAFVDEHPWASNVHVVLNFDARGTSGPSMMFETSNDNVWLIQLLARTLSRPVTSSLFNDVYERLPTYTDFTPFRQAGVQGYNFAYIRGVEHYHTARDDFDHVTPGSLQHHGDNAWQLTCALLDADLDPEQERLGDAVYTDLFAMTVVWWSQSTGQVWALLISATLWCCCVLRLRHGSMAWREFLGVGVAIPVIASLTACAGWGVDSLFCLAEFDSPWTWWALLRIVAYWITMTGVFAVLALSLLRKTNAWSTWYGVWSYWSLAAVISTFVFPAASYLFLLPLSASVLATLVADVMRRSRSQPANVVVALVSTAATGCLWIPQQFLLYDALGMEFGILYILCGAVLLLTTLPLACVEGPSDRRNATAS